MEGTTQIQKLDCSNFISWKFRVESILEGKGLDNYLIDDPPILEEQKPT